MLNVIDDSVQVRYHEYFFVHIKAVSVVTTTVKVEKEKNIQWSVLTKNLALKGLRCMKILSSHSC